MRRSFQKASRKTGSGRPAEGGRALQRGGRGAGGRLRAALWRRGAGDGARCRGRPPAAGYLSFGSRHAGERRGSRGCRGPSSRRGSRASSDGSLPRVLARARAGVRPGRRRLREQERVLRLRGSRRGVGADRLAPLRLRRAARPRRRGRGGAQRIARRFLNHSVSRAAASRAARRGGAPLGDKVALALRSACPRASSARAVRRGR